LPRNGFWRTLKTEVSESLFQEVFMKKMSKSPFSDYGHKMLAMLKPVGDREGNVTNALAMCDPVHDGVRIPGSEDAVKKDALAMLKPVTNALAMLDPRRHLTGVIMVTKRLSSERVADL
jgi:hypothetical protein